MVLKDRLLFFNRQILIASFLILLTSPAKGEVNRSLHNLCKEVTDYYGCIKANKAQKESSLYEGLTRDEAKFLRDHLKSDRMQPSKNGIWVEIKYSPSNPNFATYINTKSIKRRGNLVSLKRCLQQKEMNNKKLCDLKEYGGSFYKFPKSISAEYLYDCERKLRLQKKYTSNGISKWIPIDSYQKERVTGIHLATWQVACKN